MKDREVFDALRAQFEDALREERGQDWINDHKEMLDDQWEYLVAGKFL